MSSFRTHVEGLKIVGLTDASLDGIGDESCTVGLQAEDADDWDTLLGSVVTKIRTNQETNPPPAGTPLTEKAIEDIYSGGLFFYCPAEAKRLDVAL